MSHKRTPLAIVGIGCRMPGGVRTPDDLWEMISTGKDGYCEVPPDRWDWRRYYSEDLDVPGKIYVRSGGFLREDIKQFDAEFFGISPREAMALDPQQRLLLETSWEAIDDSGLRLDRLAGSRTGVYIGALTLDNMLTQMSTQNCRNIGPHTAASSTMTMLSNRLSYVLDLHGPSFTVDTACSSSLVAFHLACQGLWNGDCELALVGAVNVIFHPEYMVAMCKGQFLAPDGRSKSFDSRANGYGRGEGAGVIVVKPLETAIQNGDRIYAVVRGTGCNQDGKTNGITVPNPEAQKSLILSVLENSGIPGDRIQYVEAHGTGTPVGDPIEARAIGESLGRLRKEGERLMIGSVKANVGHLEAASGVTGLIKLCMCYKHGAIPPAANLIEPNPAIPFDELGLRLPTSLEPLPQNGDPVYLAINSFGYGGTNAHAILENPPVAPAASPADERPVALLPVSARSESALHAMVTRFREMLNGNRDGWREICSAAGLRRTHHKVRVAFAGGSCDQLIQEIDTWLESSAATAGRSKRFEGSAKPMFVFSGMGPQWWGMGQQLFEREPVFTEFVTRADAAFRAISGWSILEEMRRGKETSRINETIYAQPAIFVLQSGLLHLLKSWGVQPAAVMGHSLGENASAYAAGVLTLEQAAFVGHHRSQILARAANLGGGMLAVGLSEEEAQSLIAPYGDRVTIAAVNAPKNVTLAGESEALAEVAARLQVKQVFHKALKVEVAYHSAFMNPLQQPLIDALADLRPSAPQVDIYSTVTGAAVIEQAYDGPYWARNIRQSVRFLSALESAIADGHKLFLEIGAHPALAPSIREYISRSHVDAEVVSTLVRETDECMTLYKSLASLYSAGCELDWAAINGASPRMLTLPAYPWQRETYWLESEAAMERRVGGAPAGLAGRRPDKQESVWERQINSRFLPYVEDHVVQKLVLLPGAAFADAALSLHGETKQDAAAVSIEDLRFIQPLVLDRNDDVTLRTVLDEHTRRVIFYGRSERHQTGWTRHAEARLSAKTLTRPSPFDLEVLREDLSAIDVDGFYSRLTRLGLQYGPAFRRITGLRANHREVLARLTAIEAPERYDIEHVIHPALLDSAFQSLLATIPGDDMTGFVPASIDQVTVFGPMPSEVWCYGALTNQDENGVSGNIWLMDEDGNVCGTVGGLRCARIALTTNGKAALLDERLYQLTWHETALDANRSRTRSWLVIAEDGFIKDGFAAKVAEELYRGGCDDLTTVAVGASQDGDTVTDTVRTPDEWKRVFESYPPQALDGIAYVTSDRDGADADDAIERACYLLEFFKQLPADDSNLRAYLVTGRAQVVERHDVADGFLQASAAGFFRVAHNEYPGLACTVIDHDGDDASAADVAAELMAGDEADEVAWRAGVRYTQRLDTCTQLALEQRNLENRTVQATRGETYSLAHTESGRAAAGDPRRDVLYWKQEDTSNLAADELEIAVSHWRADDASRESGQLTAHDLTSTAWREFSGRVNRTGSAVKDWHAGEAVAAAALCHLASHVVVREEDLRAIRLSGAPSMDNSGLAITGASVDVALRQMARAVEGESVLVVSEPGDSVAQTYAAAAKTLGVRVLRASAGLSNEISEVSPLDLRDGEFPRRALAANNEQPIDIVVFCGSVDRALHNRIPLALGGRVVLHGNAAESVEPANLIHHGSMYSLHRVNPAALAAAGTPTYRDALVNMAGSPSGHIFGGPQHVCSADELARETAEDLRQMRGLAIDMGTLRDVVPAEAGAAMIRPDAAYVITGGFGGFGIAVADHLISCGARHVVLAGRSGATRSDVGEKIEHWRTEGIDVREALLDITDRLAVEALFAELTQHIEVKGVFHAAGVLDDTKISDMTGAQVAKVMRPKVQGAWNLHQCSLPFELGLDHFILFSSVASIVGNGRQANYVAANAVLDSLAAYRRSIGLAASSIQWGALAEVGMATDGELQRQFELMGITPMSAGDAMSGLQAVLRFQPAQIGIVNVDLVQWGKFEPVGGKSPRFAHLTGKRGGNSNDTVATALRQLSAPERFEIAEMMLGEQVANTLRIPAERMDVKRSLSDMGIDSLMAVELQIAIEMTFGVEFSALELTRGLSVSQLTGPLLERMGLESTAVAVDPGRERVAASGAEVGGADANAPFIPPPAADRAAGHHAA